MSRKRHPGYIIGNHWLETAYDRICAGEPESEVLADYGWRQCAIGQGTTQFCAMVEEAVNAEREACAQACDSVEETFADYYTMGLPGMCASKIRRRGEK